jgi:hypothetical protein
MYGVMHVSSYKQLLPIIYTSRKDAEDAAREYSRYGARIAVIGVVVELKIDNLGEQECLHRSGPNCGDSKSYSLAVEDVTAEIS